MDFYIHSIKLQDLLGRVLATFYNWNSDDQEQANNNSGTNSLPSSFGKGKSGRDVNVQILLNVDGSLNDWHKKLPLHLKVHAHPHGSVPESYVDSTDVTLFKRQATVLEAR